jgi:hypothetical protein
MAQPIAELRERLLRGGTAPRHVRRYLIELREHLADLKRDEERAGRSPADAESAALLRIGGTDGLAKAMIEQRQLQSWCVRAPWAMFGFAPVFLLGAAYLFACLILWSGWNVFLPGTDAPFVRLHGLAILYFGIGRLIYFGAPIFIGWGIGLIAARQRYQAAWPAAGLALIALIGVAARVHTARPAIPGGVGHVSMDFALGPSSLLHASVILSATILPYLVWVSVTAAKARLQRSRSG